MSVAIRMFASRPDQFFVNSFVVEASEALFVVDAQFLVSSAEALAEFVLSIGKPVAGIVITHPHPDHFNGLPILRNRLGPAPIFANRKTIEGMAASIEAKRAQWTPVYGDDYPQQAIIPEQEIVDSGHLTIAGVYARLIELGPGECMSNAVLHIPAAKAVIASDLVYSACHPWLAEGRSAAWLGQLANLAQNYGEIGTVYPGHGAAGGAGLFREQADYINGFVASVRDRSAGGYIDADDLAAIHRAAVNGREGWPLEALVDLNARAVAEELELEWRA